MEINEDKIIKVSYGVLWAMVPAVICIGIWVGTIQNGLANVNERADRQSNAILRDREETSDRFQILDAINNRLSRIEGILEEMRRK